MIPAWSDQALQAIAPGVLPETTGLVQLSDLALPGGFSRSVDPVERRQQGCGAEAGGLPPDRRDPVGGPDRARRLPGRRLGLCRGRSARASTRTSSRRPSRCSRAATGKRPSTTAGIATSHRTWIARISGVTGRAQGREQGRRHSASCSSRPRVLLVGWMIIWPILSAIGRTLWLPGRDGMRFSLETYVFFFSDQYSLNNLCVTLWTTGVCALILLPICLPIALYLRFANGPACGLCAGAGDLSDVRALDHPELCDHPRAGAERHGGPRC